MSELATHPNAWSLHAARQTRWLTPKPIVEALGHFDLDPCGAPGHYLADETYMPENGMDGLVEPWFGRVWLNPPYGREALPFLDRMVDHNQGTALLFARTETTSFFEHVWESASAVMFIRGRLSFQAEGVIPKGHNAGAPSILAAYGDTDAHLLRISGIRGQFVDLRQVMAVSPSTENGK